MKILITGAEFDWRNDTYEIKYENVIVAETKDRWNAIMMCLSKEKLEELLHDKASRGMYNNSSS